MIPLRIAAISSNIALSPARLTGFLFGASIFETDVPETDNAAPTEFDVQAQNADDSVTPVKVDGAAGATAPHARGRRHLGCCLGTETAPRRHTLRDMHAAQK